MIELERVAFAYPGWMALDGLSAAFKPGTITALVGPNGCGKSTLLKLTAGLLRPSGGSIYINGIDAARMNRVSLARSVAYMPQSRPLPDLCADAMVLHGRYPWSGAARGYSDADRRAAEAAMSRTGTLGWSGRLLAELSGGERQMVYLAAALARGASALLLDEPTTHLDVARQLDIIDILQEQRALNHTIVVAMHDINLAYTSADMWLVMERGRTAVLAPPGEAIRSEAFVRVFGVRALDGEAFGFSKSY
ncbi:iron-enterobactin transporter ATP-binding protein [Clostridia bacterium]|nr:iron-enterobactin transporter ATP-binding protein [Clostridia bacterium]